MPPFWQPDNFPSFGFPVEYRGQLTMFVDAPNGAVLHIGYSSAQGDFIVGWIAGEQTEYLRCPNLLAAKCVAMELYKNPPEKTT